MKTLHSGKNVLLKLDGDTLILDGQWGGRITRDQIALLEKAGMVNNGEDCWYGGAEHQAEVLKLVKLIDQPWVSREEERRAFQQILGGR